MLAAGLAVAIVLLVTSHYLIALLVLVALWLIFFFPTKLEVSRGSLRISWLGLRRKVEYTDMVGAGVYKVGSVPFGVAINLRNGKQIRLPVFRPALRQQRQILRAILTSIAEAQTRAGFPSIPEEVPSVPPSALRRR